MHNRTYDEAIRDLKLSLKKSGLEYFDLYLMHSAIGGPAIRKEVWRALCDAKKQGLVKSIGVSTSLSRLFLRLAYKLQCRSEAEPYFKVSNWGTKHIQELVDAGSELPVINQIDLHPWMRHPDIVSLCEKHNIVLEASHHSLSFSSAKD